MEQQILDFTQTAIDILKATPIYNYILAFLLFAIALSFAVYVIKSRKDD